MRLGLQLPSLPAPPPARPGPIVVRLSDKKQMSEPFCSAAWVPAAFSASTAWTASQPVRLKVNKIRVITACTKAQYGLGCSFSAGATSSLVWTDSQTVRVQCGLGRSCHPAGRTASLAWTHSQTAMRLKPQLPTLPAPLPGPKSDCQTGSRHECSEYAQERSPYHEPLWIWNLDA